MKKSRGSCGHVYISNPKLTRVSVILAKKDNPDRTIKASINSKFINIRKGRACLNPKQIKKRWLGNSFKCQYCHSRKRT